MIEDPKNAASIWAAWKEMSAVRARDGVPYGHVGGMVGKTDVSYEYWSNIVDRLGAMLGDECQPWASDRMLGYLPDYHAMEGERA